MAYARRDIRGGAVQTTISTGISNADTTIAITSSTGWPDGAGTKPFYVVIDPGLSSEEKVLCASRTSLSLTVTTRGADGSTASSHASGAVIYPIISAVDADEANYAVSQTVGLIASAGDLLVGSGANALAKLAKGSSSTVLQVDSGGSLGYGTVTSAMIADGTIVNADINASAAIAYSKLALTGLITSSDITDGTIVNADISASAAIAYSKLALTGAILNADLAGSIAYSKLSLTGAILNADLAGSIAVSKTLLTAGTGLSLSGNTLSVDSSFFTTGAWTSYTPTVTQSGAVTKTTTRAKYAVDGKTVKVSVYLDITGSGTHANNVTVSLPQTSVSSTAGLMVGAGNISHSGSTYPVHVLLSSTTAVKFLRSATEAASGYWGVDPDLGLTSGDAITFAIEYEMA